MFAIFGLLALVVAAVGLYSVLSFEVAQRRHEIGVRAALGAGMAGLVGLVLRQSLQLVLLGLFAGLALAYVAAGFVEGLLFQVSARDAGVYASVVGSLTVVAVLASTLPAWRATKVNPAESLRMD